MAYNISIDIDFLTVIFYARAGLVVSSELLVNMYLIYITFMVWQ